jgi:hypothetical protein
MLPLQTYILCVSTMCAFPRKQHQCRHYQPTFFAFLLCAPLQGDNINAAITNVAQVTKTIDSFLL